MLHSQPRRALPACDQPPAPHRQMVKLILTGFGSFGTVKHNPTAQLVQHIQSCPDPAGCELHSCHIIPVSTQDVDAWIADQLVPCLASVNQTEAALVLHLGVHTQATSLLLEQCCYNEATFKIPDIKGRLAAGETITDDMPLGTCYRTSLPLEAMCTRLTSQGHTVAISQDPGRYICNWVYFCSLQAASQCDKRSNIHVLFVHVPPFEVIDEIKQRSFLLDLLQVLQEQLQPSTAQVQALAS